MKIQEEKRNSKFKIGDTIEPILSIENPYNHTNHDMIKAEVIAYVYGYDRNYCTEEEYHDIRIRILEHKTNSMQIDAMWDVNSFYFRKTNIKKDFKI